MPFKATVLDVMKQPTNQARFCTGVITKGYNPGNAPATMPKPVSALQQAAACAQPDAVMPQAETGQLKSKHMGQMQTGQLKSEYVGQMPTGQVKSEHLNQMHVEQQSSEQVIHRAQAQQPKAELGFGTTFSALPQAASEQTAASQQQQAGSQQEAAPSTHTALVKAEQGGAALAASAVGKAAQAQTAAAAGEAFLSQAVRVLDVQVTMVISSSKAAAACAEFRSTAKCLLILT